MKLSEISIERPVLATVMSLAIILFGALSYTFLPVREYPDIETPVVSVNTFYRGANPQVVETEITDPLEEQLSTLEGVKLLTSSSAEQVSNITIEFVLGTDVDKAANDVRDRVSRVRGELPTTADDPIVAKQDVNAQPIMWLALYGNRYNTLELSDYAKNELAEKLQRLDGVGAVQIGGERKYAMRIWLDAQRLAAYGLTVGDVQNALRGGNAEIPAGRVEGKGREFAVRTRGDLDQPEQFANIIVSENQDRVVKLGDVAQISLGAEDDRSIARYNRQPAVGLGVIKQQKASTVDVAHAVQKALPRLRENLPAGMQLDAAYDGSTFIDESIKDVVITLGIAVLLVFFVIFVFLGSVRATLIPAIAIPVSVIGTFTITYALGFSINILTLLALVLAIGLVVDDAIVMLENIHRHMELGKPRLKASIEASREIGFAILATTITLVAVFVPVAFLKGYVGRLFSEFGVAVAVSVLISGFVALTLTPMLCSRFLRGTHEGAGTGGESRFRRGFDGAFARLMAAYDATLTFAVRRRFLVLGATALMLVATVVLFKMLPSETVPTEDRGLLFTVIRSPEGATLDYTDRYVQTVEGMYDQVPAKDRMFTAIGLFGPVTDGFMFVGLTPQGKRPPAQAIAGMMFPKLFSIPGVMAFAFNPPSLSRGFGQPVQYVLKADSYDELSRSVGLMMSEAQKLGYLINVDTDLKLNKPQIEIQIDRDRAAELGVSVADIGNTLQVLLGSAKVTRFKRGTHQYDVMLQLPRSDRSSPEMINDLYVHGPSGLVQLASVVKVEEKVSPRELNHFNRVRAATISANLAPGVTIGQALDDLDRIAKRVLPPGVQTDLAGDSREFKESSGGLNFLFLIALVFIFLVLAAQFESFVHPLTILFSVPLAVFGALLSLFVCRMTINIFSQVGLIMLIGLVTKNAILIVEYANQRRASGEAVTDAVIAAAKIRLRPILMTTFATIFGILPIALGLGAGAESRKPLGMAVVGGMIFSTFLTLVVVPVVYTMLARFSPVRAEKKAEEVVPAGTPAYDGDVTAVQHTT